MNVTTCDKCGLLIKNEDNVYYIKFGNDNKNVEIDKDICTQCYLNIKNSFNLKSKKFEV